MTGNHRFISNADQPRCPCGKFASVLHQGTRIDRVRCDEHGVQELWKQHERIENQQS